MTTRADLVAEALTWEATPYHAQACVKGVGVDCAMFLVGVGKACGCLAPDWQPETYSPTWHLHQREERLAQTMEALGGLRLDGPGQPGDIVAFRFSGRQPISHMGILLPDDQLIHAVYGRAVVRHGLAGRWARAACQAWAFPGVD